jgi:hypothetical protein
MCSVLGCASEREGRGFPELAAEAAGPVAGAVGVVWMASELSYLEPEYLAGMLVAYGIYDPLAPTWSIEVSRSGEDRVRMDLHMRRLATGGDGEARRVFLRNARELAQAGGFAGFDELSWEEGIESTRPFARRFASGEIRLVRSMTFPGL